MAEQWVLIIGLAVATFTIRLGGYLLGAKLPSSGAAANAFSALPGCLISALLTVIVLQGGSPEWVAAAVALVTAIFSRSLVLTMLVGIVVVWLMRHYG